MIVAWTSEAIYGERRARRCWASAEQNSWTAETWREFDVTGAVAGNGTYTFGAATSLNSGLLDFWSKESWLYVPDLVVTSRPGP